MSIPILPPVVRKVVARAKEVAAPASKDERERRAGICRTCPRLTPTPIERCSLCGCPIVSKTAFQRATCPDNPPRW